MDGKLIESFVMDDSGKIRKLLLLVLDHMYLDDSVVVQTLLTYATSHRCFKQLIENLHSQLVTGRVAIILKSTYLDKSHYLHEVVLFLECSIGMLAPGQLSSAAATFQAQHQMIVQWKLDHIHTATRWTVGFPCQSHSVNC